jgi:alkylated DNA nucleotide flippase Atl1
VSDVVFVVVEQSPVGETVVGIFSSLEAARRIVPPAASGRLQDYRIEGHVVDATPDSRTPWQVVIDRDGSVQAAELADI